jgi:hypothetical protein
MKIKIHLSSTILFVLILLVPGIQPSAATENKKPDVQKNRDRWFNSLTPAGKSGFELTMAGAIIRF